VKIGRGIASPFVEIEIVGCEYDSSKYKTDTKGTLFDDTVVCYCCYLAIVVRHFNVVLIYFYGTEMVQVTPLRRTLSSSP